MPATRDESWRFFLEHLEESSEECRIWPYNRNLAGYPRVGIPGEGQYYVHILVCERVHGPKPSVKSHAAHRCGNRSCWNPAHLRWATPAENAIERSVHADALGSDRRGTNHKLASDKVREIRSLYAGGGITQKELGQRFGVHQSVISDVVHRKTWSWLD